MNEMNDEAFALVFNPYENNSELTDDERLQVLSSSLAPSVFASASPAKRLHSCGAGCCSTAPRPTSSSGRASVSPSRPSPPTNSDWCSPFLLCKFSHN
jgi:hypothetical protein